MKSIRWRLVAAFAGITMLAVSSALTTWYLLGQRDKQSGLILESTISLTNQAQALGREVTLFAFASRDLSRLTSTDQQHRLLVHLRARLARIDALVSDLELLEVVRDLLPGLRARIIPLDENLGYQRLLVDQYLARQLRLSASFKELEEKQKLLNRIIASRMAANYQQFLDTGRQIETDLSALPTADAIATDTTVSERLLANGFESLITAATGELRATHEAISATMQGAGLLYQAAIAEQIDQVEKLQAAYQQLRPALTRATLLLVDTAANNRRPIIADRSILARGRGEHAIFTLRLEELKAREKVAAYSAQAIAFAEAFSAQMTDLSVAATTASQQESERLSRAIYQARLWQVVVVFVAIIIGVIIGWFYVGTQLVGRITSLKMAMDQHAMGIESEIPMKGNDELTEMANALQCFIFQRKMVESALRQSLAFLNEAQQIAKFGSCIIDRGKGLWEFSDGFFAMLGYAPGELSVSAETFYQLILPRDRERLHGLLGRLTSDASVRQTEICMTAKNGAIQTVFTRWKYPTDGRSDDDVILGTLLDITERQRMEEALHKVKKLESVGILAGGIAHDFNNLLTVVLGNLSLALRELAKDHPVYELLNLAKSGTLRAKDLTKQLLAFARAEEPDKAAADLSKLLAETTASVMAGSKSSCRIEAVAEPWPVVIDIGQMGQVLQNILVNADQSMAAGGELIITSENVTLGADEHAVLEPGNYVKLALADQGCGISAEHLKTIFDPYFTTKVSDSNRGSGLGLAIVHSIIRKHGGAVEVVSTVGQGTTFTMYIPAQPETEVTTTTQPADRQTARPHILVMDDEEMIRNVCKSMLEHCGYTVSLSGDGEEAVRRYRELDEAGNKPDVVLVDLTVPDGMGGQQAATEILDYDRQARIIISSGYATDQLLENFQDYGFCGMTTKPYQINSLVTVIAEALDCRQ